MERKIFLSGVTFLILVLFSIIDSAAGKADPRDCEVCISVLERFVNQTTEKNLNPTQLEEKFIKFCKGLKGKDHKICYYLGAVDNAPTRMVRSVTKPLSYYMHPTKVCEKLKKVDADICGLRYEKQIDLANTNLKKLRVNELKKILAVWGEDNACKGCMEKSDFIKEIERLLPKYDPEAHKKRTEKKEL